jgi:hypothetical protein
MTLVLWAIAVLLVLLVSQTELGELLVQLVCFILFAGIVLALLGSLGFMLLGVVRRLTGWSPL